MMPPSLLAGKLLIPFIAPPNGGKGTQTRILSERHGLPTFDMGASFRAILKEGKNPDLAQELYSYMSVGKLVPIETVIKVFKSGFEDLAARHPESRGFILDGFPRNDDQADALDALCKEWRAAIPCVIYLKVGLDTVETRATGRRFCAKDARHVYNIHDERLKPKQWKKTPENQTALDADGLPIGLCDEDGSELVMRPDDAPETVRKRLKEYAQETDPLIARFRANGLLAEIDGEQSPDAVTTAIEASLQFLSQPADSSIGNLANP